MRRALLALTAAAVLLGAVVWVFQDALLLLGLRIGTRLARPVAPHREITWDSGGDPLRRPPEERPPNFILILADDLGWNDVSFWGGGVADGTVPTRSIDALAREGVAFRQGYAAHSSCAPSRAALLTGRYGTRFGFEFTPTPPRMTARLARMAARSGDRLRRHVVTHAPVVPFERMGMPSSEITLAELLRDAGYHTVHIGKWHLGREPGMLPRDQGFDESLLLTGGLYLPERSPEVVNSKQDFDPLDRYLRAFFRYAVSFNGSPDFAPRGYLTDYFTDEALRVIEANRDRPFFLYLAHFAPHTPLQALRSDYEALSHIDHHRLRVYAAMVRALDRSVGRILAALDRLGLSGRTLVAFTSDNGAPAYVGLPDLNRPFRGWKMTFFEGGIRVPTFLRWPGRIPAGTIFEDPVHGVDFYATAAAAAGVALPADRVVDGVDLVARVLGEVPGRPHPRLFWRAGHYRAVREGDWKLQVSKRPNRSWLFDLARDPAERQNLADREPERVRALEGILEEHNARQAEPLWPPVVEIPVNVDKDLTRPDEPGDEYVYTPN